MGGHSISRAHPAGLWGHHQRFWVPATDQNVPYSASIGAWYYYNHHEWCRLSIENGGSQLIRECRDPTWVVSRKKLLQATRSMADEIQDEKGITFHEEFKKDVTELEAGGTLTLRPSDPLRSRIAHFMAENYTSKEAGRVMCPAFFWRPHMTSQSA